ncbi:MAG TPA: acyl-CoA dehydrogenase family protein [Thermaerobacter sp.]
MIPVYDFRPTPEQEAVLERTRALMDAYVYPAEAEFFRTGTLPEERLKAIQQAVKDAGLWAPHMPREAGGLGMGMVTLALMNEILGRSPLAPRAFGTSAPDTGNQEILWMFGTPEQKERFLKPNLAGEVYSCFAMTEPEVSGSDPTTLRTRAVRDGDHWVINGHKWFITNAARSAFAIVMAVTDPEAPPHRRATMIIVPTDTPGFRIVRHVPVMDDGGGLGTHDEIVLEDCRVPVENTLGPVGEGFRIAQARLGPGRITHAMRWIGVMNRSFEMMVQRALTRETRGQRLAEFQTIQNFVADSYAEIQAARLLTLYAAWRLDQGLDARKEISLIKFFGANVLHRVVDRALQVHGALGYSKDTPLELFYREARAARIYDGPDEVHRVVVAKRIFKEFAPVPAATGTGAGTGGTGGPGTGPEGGPA